MDIGTVKRRLNVKVAGEMYRSFMKATENMAEEKRNQIIDQHVMGFVHHMLHDIGDHARGHAQAGEEMAQADKTKASAKAKQSAMEEEIRTMLNKIVGEFAEYKISNPEQIPHVYHMVEHHPVLQRVIMGIAKHEMTLDTAVKMVVNEIGQEKEHDRHDVSASMFEKSSSSMFGMFGAYSFPSYPVAFSSSALSRFRPSPPFLKDTTECPDERFIKMLMKTKYDGKEEETRPVEPADNSHIALAERAGIPHHLIAGKVLKSQDTVNIIKQRISENKVNLNKSMNMVEAIQSEDIWKGGRAHNIRLKNNG